MKQVVRLTGLKGSATQRQKDQLKYWGYKIPENLSKQDASDMISNRLENGNSDYCKICRHPFRGVMTAFSQCCCEFDEDGDLE